MSSNFLKTTHTRLLDVFYIGPIHLLVSKYVDNDLLKLFMIYTGLGTIIYNGHNYLYIDRGVMDKSMIPLVHDTQGKYQIHRLFNVLIMYPVFNYIYNTTEIPQPLKKLFRINMILGFLFNLYYLIVSED